METYKNPQKMVAELTGWLNRYRREYYNDNAPSVSDVEYGRDRPKLCVNLL